MKRVLWFGLCAMAAASGGLAGSGCGGGDGGAAQDAAVGDGAVAGDDGAAGGDGAVAGDGGALVDLDAGPLQRSVEAALAADGFSIGSGRFEILDLTDCCMQGRNCSGNNPSSPYGSFRVPRAPGQTVPNAREDASGRSDVVRLRADEALLYLGQTPPRAVYFGYTPYLMDRDDGAGGRRSAFASLSETLNSHVIATAGADAFAGQVAIIATPDAATEARVRAALLAGGWPAGAINTIVFDPTLARFGLEQAADTFAILFRVALWADAGAGAAFLARPPGVVLRLTPATQAPAPQPFARPAARPKNAGGSEAGLRTSVDALGAAIAARYAATHVGSALEVTGGVPDPDACIMGTSSCAGDNRNTNYPATRFFQWLEGPDDFLVVYGVDHQVTRKASYASVSVYALQHLVGVASVTSRDWAGSAADYVPASPQVGSLYAWKIKRDCGSEAHCLSVPVAMCPSGIEAGRLSTLAFRTYVEPGYATAPDVATLELDRVMRFVKR